MSIEWATNEFVEDLVYLENSLPREALLEALAEEACELAHAALKCSKYLRQENPTDKEPNDPTSEEVYLAHVRKEFNDLVARSMVLGLGYLPEQVTIKIHEWREKVERKQSEASSNGDTQDGVDVPEVPEQSQDSAPQWKNFVAWA